MATLEELRRDLARHLDDLEGYAAFSTWDLLDDFEGTEAAILGILYEIYEWFREHGKEPSAETRRYIENIYERLLTVRADIEDDLDEELEDVQLNTAKAQNEYYGWWYAELYGASSRLLTQDEILHIARDGVFNGDTRRTALDGLFRNEAQRLAREMVRNAASGAPLDQAVAETRREMERTRQMGKGVIDEIINGAGNEAAAAFAVKNKALMMYTAVMDSRTCSECSHLDGTVYDMDADDVPIPPRHYNCRCQLVPVPPASGGGGQPMQPMGFGEYLAGMTETERAERLGTARLAEIGGDVAKLREYEPWRNGRGRSLADFLRRDAAARQALTYTEKA